MKIKITFEWPDHRPINVMGNVHKRVSAQINYRSGYYDYNY